MKKKYTPEIIDFLKQHVNGRSAKELTIMVNAYFSLSFTERQISSTKCLYGLKSGTKYTGVLNLEQIKFLETNVRGKTFAEVAILFNNYFKTDFTSRQIKNLCLYRGIKNNMLRIKGGHYWTEDEISFLKKHAGEKTQRGLVSLINDSLNLSLTYQEIRHACSYYKIETAKVPVKCTREIADFIWQNSKETIFSLTKMINATFGTVFSKDQVAKFVIYYKYKTVYKRTHELPMYTERIKTYGRTYIKVSMGGPYKQRWKEKHRWLWEQANGRIPEGMKIIFLDNNPLNCRLENLAMVNMAEHIVMAKSGLYTDNPEVTLAGIAIAKHLLAIHNRLEKSLGKRGRTNFIYKASRNQAQEQKRGKS
jgi:hypothetical protein